MEFINKFYLKLKVISEEVKIATKFTDIFLRQLFITLKIN